MSSASLAGGDFPYVPKPELIAALDEFAEVDFELLQQTQSPSPTRNGHKHRHKSHSRRKQNCVFSIAGESGAGKTSLLKYWSRQRQLKNRANSFRTADTNPVGSASSSSSSANSGGSSSSAKEFIFFYGVNSSRDAQLSNMLGKLESALKFHFQLRELLVRASPAHRRWDLVRYLESSAKKSRTPIIIVIDGLSRLKMESGVEADPMLWLPRDLPNKVRFIVSLTEYEIPPVENNGRKKKTASMAREKTASFVELERRKTPSLHLGVLSLATRRTILTTYAQYHRSSFDLTNDKVMQILASQSSGHPLYLRVLLNSLRTAARLSCIPAIAVGTLIDAVMERELHGWSVFAPNTNQLHDKEDARDDTMTPASDVTSVSLIDTLNDSRPHEDRNGGGVTTPTPTTPLTWEERQQTMSRGALTAADQEVAGLLERSSLKHDQPHQDQDQGQGQNMSLVHATGALPSAVEMVIGLALQRCEEDVEMELDGSDKGLLGRVLSLLYVSHHGLTENELLGCVALAARENMAVVTSQNSKQSTSSAPTPVEDGTKWHESFHQQFEQHRETLRLILDDICMVVRAVDVADSTTAGGDLSTADPDKVRVIMEHESVRRVVWTQYLGGSALEKDRNHTILAKYFETLVPVSQRRIEELPWHYEQLQEYGKLRDTVTDVDMFRLWWGDSKMEFYRPELIRVWSVLTMPPLGLDLVEEIRTAFEMQILARHMRDDAISVLMLQVAELTIAFQRGGWESSATGLDCPDQRHPAIPLSVLVQNGIPLLQPDPEGEETGENDQFVELVKTSRHNLDDGPLPGVTHETVEFIGEHYYYSRWMWAQYPLILLGFADMYSARVARMAAAKSSSMSAEKSPTKRDPIISRLKQLAQKLENPNQNEPAVDDNKKKRKDQDKAKDRKKGNKKDGDRLKTPIKHLGGTGGTEDENEQGKEQTRKQKKLKKKISTSQSPNLAQKTRPHPNSPFILDVHSGDRHEKRIESLTQSIMKQRRVMNAIIIAERGKEKKLKIIREELTVLNGLSKGEAISLDSALELVSDLETMAKRTNEVNTLSNFYRNILQLCKAFGANQPEWLQILDDDIEKGRRKQTMTKVLIKAVREQRRQILALLNEARTTHFRRRGVLSQMLDRIDFQHARELENVKNEKQWKQRQEIMLHDDIVNENRLKMQRAEDERKATEQQNQVRRQARNDKLAVWRARLQRLKDATGVSTIAEMLSIVSSRSQLTTENNLSVLVTEQETNIASLTLQREKLRNEMMKLRFSYNKANSGGILATSPKGNKSQPSPIKKELHHIAEKEMAVQRTTAQVEHIRRELAHVNNVIMNVKVGLEHITRMCGVNFDDAEQAREEESKKKTLYFEPSNDISERDRAQSTMDLLAKVEIKLIGKIADLQRLAPSTPKSRDRKRRRRQSKSRDGRRRSQSRDGRVGSPLSREGRVSTPLSPLNLRSISRGSSTGNSADNRPGSRQSRPMTQETSGRTGSRHSRPMTQETLSRAVSRGSSMENLMRPLSRQLNSRQNSFRGSRPSTQGSMDLTRPDTPETDEDSHAFSQQNDIRRWRKMWPKIVQTNDAAILKAKAMAKNLGSIGKDLNEVQSSLWKHKANKNMARLGTGGGGGGGGERDFNSKLDQNVVRKVFVNLSALKRPVSADVSGTGIDVPIVSFKRDGGFSMHKKRLPRHQQHQGKDLKSVGENVEEESTPTREEFKMRNQEAIQKMLKKKLEQEEADGAMDDFF